MLAEPAQKMAALFNELKKDKDFPDAEYKKEINKQILSFYEAVLRLKKTEKYLYEVERSKNNIGKLYYYYFRELEGQNEPLEKAWPKLKNFLDKNYPVDIN